MFESKNSNVRLAALHCRCSTCEIYASSHHQDPYVLGSAPGPLHCRKYPRFELARDLNPTVSDPRNFIEAVLYEISKNIVAFATGDDIATCDKIIRLIASASSMTGLGGITYSDCDAQ